MLMSGAGGLEKEFDAIGGPGGDPGSEEVGIFGPDGTAQCQGSSQYGPVRFIPPTQADASSLLKCSISFRFD